MNGQPEIRVPERNKKRGVCYAVTDDGIELPVIDVTHPAFACDVSAAALSALIDAAVQGLATVKNTPPDVMRTIAAKSILARGWLQSVGSFMDGITTYLNRLGPENLGDGYAGPIDRTMAAGLMPLTFRFRLRDVARLIADALASRPPGPNDRLVSLFNIGGGVAADSMNGLILLNKECPRQLSAARISIHVLDVDRAGPSFGRRALAALIADGPLAGLDASFRDTAHDWADVARLRTILTDIGDIGAGLCSSEGALFDYGSDDMIVGNLQVLREATPREFVVVGSVVRDVATLDPRLEPTTLPAGRPLIRYLGLTAFQRLARRSGWTIDRVIDSVAHHAVALRKIP